MLTESEAELLLQSMRHLTETGIAIIFISHRLNEIMNVCDEIVILRDGEVFLETQPKKCLVHEIASSMAGRNMEKQHTEVIVKNKPVRIFCFFPSTKKDLLADVSKFTAST